MYFIDDRKSAVAQIQRYLYTISAAQPDLAQTPIDGFYEEDTRRAVVLFQKKNALEETGRVDLSTFSSLYDSARRAQDAQATNVLRDLRYGDDGDDVLRLNRMLSHFSRTYRTVGRVPDSSFYTKETEAAVGALQKILKFEENGVADRLFQQRLAKEIDIEARF